VSEGQRVGPGDIIAEVETESATHEIESSGEGRIASILVPSSPNVVAAGTPLALVEAMAPATATVPPRDPMPLSPLAFASGLLSEAEGAEAFGPQAERGDEALEPMSYRDALASALAEDMGRDPTVVVLGYDVRQTPGATDVLQGFAEKFGEDRVIAISVVEETCAALAVGMALGGLRPVVVFSSWRSGIKALTEISETLADMPRHTNSAGPLPIVFRARTPDGEEGAPSAAALSAIPGLKVVCPASPAGAKAAMAGALRDGGPVAIIEEASLADRIADVPSGRCEPLLLGRARLMQTGADATLVTYGRHVDLALEAAVALASKGTTLDVLDLVSLAPLDMEAVRVSVQRTGRLVTFEDAGSGQALGRRIVADVATHAFASLNAAPLMLDESCLTSDASPDEKPAWQALATAVTAVFGGPIAPVSSEG
jgi:pyruvate dehydrogenase E1 component beta subunit